MPTSPLQNEDEKTWARLFRTAGALYRLRELELDRVRLYLSEASTLYYLSVSTEPVTPSKLSRFMHKQQHTTASLLRSMEKRGLVKTTKDLPGKNLVRVSLTQKGEAAFQRQISQRRAMNITACLSREEVAVLNTVLMNLHDAAVEMIRDMRPSPPYEPLDSH